MFGSPDVGNASPIIVESKKTESPYVNQQYMFKAGNQSTASELEVVYAPSPSKYGELKVDTKEVLQILNERTPEHAQEVVASSSSSRLGGSGMKKVVFEPWTAA